MLKKPPSEGGLVRLPGDLAERIVELELELEEGQLSEAALGRLLAAYSVNGFSNAVSHQLLH